MNQRNNQDRRNEYRRTDVRRAEDNSDPDFLIPDLDTKPPTRIGRISTSRRLGGGLNITRYVLLTIAAALMVGLGVAIDHYWN
jgi:hypothetical protein